jgi:hypothetical protein
MEDLMREAAAGQTGRHMTAESENGPGASLQIMNNEE